MDFENRQNFNPQCVCYVCELVGRPSNLLEPQFPHLGNKDKTTSLPGILSSNETMNVTVWSMMTLSQQMSIPLPPPEVGSPTSQVPSCLLGSTAPINIFKERINCHIFQAKEKMQNGLATACQPRATNTCH